MKPIKMILLTLALFALWFVGDCIAIEIDQALVGDGPYYLDQADLTYTLTENISTPGTALVVSAPGVTLDLGGRVVVYGTSGQPYSYGVAVPPHYQHSAKRWRLSDITKWNRNDRPTIRNGQILQVIAGGDSCAAVIVAYADDVIVEGIEVAIYGDDTHAILCQQNTNLIVRDCTVRDYTKVVSNRHQGRAAIDIQLNKGTLSVTDNEIVNAAQWGIRVTRQGEIERGEVAHNLISSQGVVVNCYGLGIHGDKLDVHDNLVDSIRGMGVHIGEGADGIRFFDNTVSVMCPPTWATHDRINAHGLALERCTNTEVYGNYILSIGVWADQLANGIGCAFKISCRADQKNWVHHNTFEARYVGGAADRLQVLHGCMVFYIDEIGAGMLTFENNICVTQDRFICIYELYDGGSGQKLPHDLRSLIIRNNTWTREPCLVLVQGWDIVYGGSNVYNLTILNPTGCDFRNTWLGWRHLPNLWSVYFNGIGDYSAHFEGQGDDAIRWFSSEPPTHEQRVLLWIDGEEVEAAEVRIERR